MYEELTRELNERERAELRAATEDAEPLVSLGVTLRWITIWGAGLLVCVVFGAGLFAFDPHPVLVILVVILGLGAVVCLYALITILQGYFHWRGVHARFRRVGVPRIQAALSHGGAQAKRVRAVAVVEIQEYEDEGPGYIYDVEDGKLLFLKGQQYYPVDESSPWPNTEFEIVRASEEDVWVGIFCHGDELAPSRVIASADCREEIAWDEREELVDGPMEVFVDSILDDAAQGR